MEYGDKQYVSSIFIFKAALMMQECNHVKYISVLDVPGHPFSRRNLSGTFSFYTQI